MEDSSQIVVAQRGTVAIGPVGVAVDEDPDVALPGSFTDLGYTTTDGATFGASVDVTDIDAWQSATPVRRIVTGRGTSASFSLEQWNADNFALAFGGGEWTVDGDVAIYTPPADTDAIAEYQLAIDFADGDKKGRLVVFRGNVADSVETTLTRGGASLLPITFTGLTPDGEDRSWRYSTNDPELVAGVGS
jgi:hypothetical protein